MTLKQAKHYINRVGGIPLLGLLAAMAVTPVQALETDGYSCVTEPFKDATLSMPVTGQIEKLHIKEGDKVASGAILVTLESALEDLEVKRRELIWKGKTELEAAEIHAKIYKSLLASTRELYEVTKSVSKEELDKMELEYGTAEAERKRAEIGEEREKIEFQLAKANLERKRLRAPFAGTIVEIKLQEGESVEANQPLVQLVDVSKGFLVCNVEERAGRSVSTSQKVPVRIQTGDGFWEGEGQVVFASPVVDAASGLIRLRVKFDNKEGVVRPGVAGYIQLAP